MGVVVDRGAAGVEGHAPPRGIERRKLLELAAERVVEPESHPFTPERPTALSVMVSGRLGEMARHRSKDPA